MADSAQDDLIIAIAQEVVAEIAPQELPLFRAVSAAYRKKPAGVTGGRPGRESPLAFGVDPSVFLTPVALAVAHQVVLFLIEEMQKAAKDAATALLREQVEGLFKRLRPGADAAPPLTSQQLAAVRRVAIAEARRLKLPDARAELLADSLVGRLAVATPQ